MAMQDHQLIRNHETLAHSPAGSTSCRKLFVQIGTTEYHHYRGALVSPFPLPDHSMAMACMKSNQKIPDG
jgi:hypothetical protein